MPSKNWPRTLGLANYYPEEYRLSFAKSSHFLGVGRAHICSCKRCPEMWLHTWALQAPPPSAQTKNKQRIRWIQRHSVRSGSFTEVNSASGNSTCKSKSAHQSVLVFVVVLCSGENTYGFAQILLHGTQSLVRAEFTQEIFTEPLARRRGWDTDFQRGFF